MRVTVAATFDQQYAVEPNGCFVWLRARAGKEAKRGGGYGCFRVNGKLLRAHTFAWERANGRPVPQGTQVLHGCNNTLCVNPEHLRIGTNDENQRDRVLHGGAAKKLTPDAVRRIRARVAEGVTQRAVAAEFSLSNQHVSEIVNRKVWRHFD